MLTLIPVGTYSMPGLCLVCHLHVFCWFLRPWLVGWFDGWLVGLSVYLFECSLHIITNSLAIWVPGLRKGKCNNRRVFVCEAVKRRHRHSNRPGGIEQTRYHNFHHPQMPQMSQAQITDPRRIHADSGYKWVSYIMSVKIDQPSQAQ